MSKLQITKTAISQAIHVARDAHPAPARVREAADHQAETARQETAAIKAKRAAA